MKKIRNLVTTDGGRRYVWDVNQGQLEYFDGETSQTFLLTSRPYFNVQSLKLSVFKNYMALIGDQGITVIELPSKFSTLYKSPTKDRKIYCNTFDVCERLFKCDKRIRVLHADWHPAFGENTQVICFLTNDNKLRIWNSSDELETQTIDLSVSVASEDRDVGDDLTTNFSLLNLSEKAVCFDFSPKIVSDCGTILWPIYILIGSCDILLIYTNPDNPDFAENIVGPLTILPQVEDNYGSDACSLIVLDSEPPMLAIATPSGLIYHAFAFIDSKALLPAQILYMYESIELNRDLIENSDDPYTLHNMQLFKDPTSRLRYFCAHENGVHTVVCPILESLDSNMTITKDLDSLSEFLICTKVTTSQSNCDDDGIPRGLGVEIRNTGIVLIVLSSKNELIEHRISPATTLISKRIPRRDLNKSGYDDENFDASRLEASRADFETQITQIIKRSVNLPILKLSGKSNSDTNVGKLIRETIATLKAEYVSKYELALETIQKKTDLLKKDINNQQLAYDNFSSDKEELFSYIENLNSKTKTACQKQEELLKRADKLLSMVISGNQAELYSKDLEKLKYTILAYRTELDTIRNKHHYTLESKKSSLGSRRPADFNLSRNQMENIKSTLAKQSSEISELKRIVKSLQKTHKMN